MKEVFVWIDEIQLREYIRYFGRGPLTQDDDFLAAIWMKKFYELKLNKSFTIGFKVATERKDDLPDWNNAVLGDLHHVLDKMRKQNDSIDFALSEGMARDTRGAGFAFQVKRLMSCQITTQASADYINNLWKKYGTSRLKLALFLIIGDASFDIKDVHELLDGSRIPFSQIYFMSVHSPHVYFGELHPRVGADKFPIGQFQ